MRYNGNTLNYLQTDKTMKLSPELKEKASTIRTNLAKAISNFDALNAEIKALEANKPTLETEIASLEAATNPDDDNSINRVLRLREKLRLTTNRVSLLEQKIVSASDDMMKKAKETRAVIREILNPEYGKLIKAIVDSFAPFYENNNMPTQLSEQTDMARSFFYFIQGPTRSDKDDPKYANGELQIIDEILANKNPWQFKRAI